MSSFKFEDSSPSCSSRSSSVERASSEGSFFEFSSKSDTTSDVASIFDVESDRESVESIFPDVHEDLAQTLNRSFEDSGFDHTFVPTRDMMEDTFDDVSMRSITPLEGGVESSFGSMFDTSIEYWDTLLQKVNPHEKFYTSIADTEETRMEVTIENKTLCLNSETDPIGVETMKSLRDVPAHDNDSNATEKEIVVEQFVNINLSPCRKEHDDAPYLQDFGNLLPTQSQDRLRPNSSPVEDPQASVTPPPALRLDQSLQPSIIPRLNSGPIADLPVRQKELVAKILQIFKRLTQMELQENNLEVKVKPKPTWDMCRMENDM